jgi:hypothetical protein
MGLRSALGRQGLRYGWVLGGAVVAAAENFEMCPGRQRQGRGRSVPSGFGHDRFGARRPADQDRRDRPGGHRVRGDDESPFIEAGIPVGGAENGDEEEKTAKQAKAWGGQAGEVYDPCYDVACDTHRQRQPGGARPLHAGAGRNARPLRDIHRRTTLTRRAAARAGFPVGAGVDVPTEATMSGLAEPGHGSSTPSRK